MPDRLLFRSSHRCFFVVGHDGRQQLAFFAREVGLGRDRKRYLSIHRPNADRTHLGRIGEMYTWAGPIGIDEGAPMVRELRAQCGDAPLMHVGIPETSNIFNTRHGLLHGPIPAPPPPPRAKAPG
ncbi:MAG TPA: hypothetical protein VFK50_05485 [Sphingomicrobium sp.]|nr:hypothetical protein [Sphingomicrobium sp.]